MPKADYYKSFPAFDYKALGDVVAYAHTANYMFLVLVYTGSQNTPYVVAAYENGSRDRMNGTYFTHRGDAYKHYCERLLDFTTEFDSFAGQ